LLKEPGTWSVAGGGNAKPTGGCRGGAGAGALITTVDSG
jgi:hypothetical protein